MNHILQVLDYYSNQGIVDVTPLSLPGYQPNLPILQHMYLKSKLNNKRQNELIPYNDCLYRNMYRYNEASAFSIIKSMSPHSRYDYIAVLDQDEVIVPVYHNTWADMLHEVQAIDKYGRAAWMFNNYVFFWQEQSQNSLHLPK